MYNLNKYYDALDELVEYNPLTAINPMIDRRTLKTIGPLRDAERSANYYDGSVAEEVHEEKRHSPSRSNSSAIYSDSSAVSVVEAIEQDKTPKKPAILSRSWFQYNQATREMKDHGEHEREKTVPDSSYTAGDHYPSQTHSKTESSSLVFAAYRLHPNSRLQRIGAGIVTGHQLQAS